MDLFDDDGPLENDPVEQLSIACAVFKTIWDEFLIRERDECRRILRSLSSTFQCLSSSPQLEIHGIEEREIYVNPEESLFHFHIEEFSPSSSSLTAFYPISPLNISASSSWIPHPRYEICTPTSRNVARDVKHDVYALFAPYADDPKLNLRKFMEMYEGFAWQIDWQDPDVEMIELETARRLHFENDFSFQAIDLLNMFTKLRISSKLGLLRVTSHRDKLTWPGVSHLTGLPVFSTNFSSQSGANVFEEINRHIPSFCPNLLCIHSECDIHYDLRYPPLNATNPTITGESMRLATDGQYCGSECFRRFDGLEDMHMESVHWSNPNDEVFLANLLKLTPDLTPCQLAPICRKPCHEIFAYRSRLFPDDVILEQQPEQGLARPDLGTWKPVDSSDNSNLGLVPLSPCNHKGPCNRRFPDCHCAKNNRHCQRNCRCGIDCEIRWKGCGCGRRKSSGSRLCKDHKCPCREADRECDPELCVNCDARGKLKSKRCRNVDVQRQHFPAIKIARSQWGLGAYATRKIPAERVIGEYVGEMYANKDNSSFVLEELAKYTKLNYCFEHNEDFCVDSAKAGNETRYLNHSLNPNCRSQIPLVNNVHCNVLMTTRSIKPGEELFLDYGEAYWKHHNMSITTEDGACSMDGSE